MLFEDESAESSDLRSAILPRRNSDADRFLPFVHIKSTADYKHDFLKGFHDLTGDTPPNHPIILKPGVQYEGLVEISKVAPLQEIDEKNKANPISLQYHLNEPVN